jgi:hypothetical protein
MHESVEIYVKGFDAPTPPIQRDGILVIIIGFNYCVFKGAWCNGKKKFVQISSSSYFFVNLSDVTSTLITNQ